MTIDFQAISYTHITMDIPEKELYKIFFDWNKNSSSKKLSINSDKIQLNSSASGFKNAFGNFYLHPGNIYYWEFNLVHGVNFIIGIKRIEEDNEEVEDLQEMDDNGKYWYETEGGYALTSHKVLKWKTTEVSKMTYGRSFQMGDKIGVLLNSNSGTLTYFINDVCFGPAFVNKELKEGVFVPVVGMLVDGETIELVN